MSARAAARIVRLPPTPATTSPEAARTDGRPRTPGHSQGPPPTRHRAPSIIPLRPLSIGEILGGAFESLRANPKAMFVPSLVVMSVVGLLSAGSLVLFLSRLDTPGVIAGSGEITQAEAQASLDQLGSSFVGLFAQLGVTVVLGTMATSIIVGLLIVTVSRTILGRKASLSDVWQRTKPRAWALIGQTLLILGWALLGNIITNGADEDSAGVIMLAVLVILAVTAVLGLSLFALICKLCLAPAALVLENIGVLEGISRSWTLTRGYFWRIVGIRLLSFLIVLVASQAASYGVSLITQGLVYAAPDALIVLMALSTLLNSLVQAAILPFDSSVIALM